MQAVFCGGLYKSRPGGVGISLPKLLRNFGASYLDFVQRKKSNPGFRLGEGRLEAHGGLIDRGVIPADLTSLRSRIDQLSIVDVAQEPCREF